MAITSSTTATSFIPETPVSQNEIQFYYQNVNGIISTTFPIYIFVDTNLNASVQSHEFFPPTFNVFRCDRIKLTSHKTTHGGVLIAVDNKIKSEMELHGESSGCEQLWWKISSNQCNFTRQLHNLTDANDTIFLCVDFNHIYNGKNLINLTIIEILTTCHQF